MAIITLPLSRLGNNSKLRIFVTTFSLMSIAALSTATKTAPQCASTNPVPQRLLLSQNLQAADLQSASLYPIETLLGTIKESPSTVRSGDAIQKHMGEHGAICYVVRRPGCVFCREEGLALVDLYKNPELQGFGFFGTIKETGVDDDGLLEFAKLYPFPLYRDADLTFYEALGNRRLTLETWNPIRIFNGVFWLREAMKRVGDKKLDGNLKGEGLLKGGVIIFGKDGKQKYAYAEETFEEFPSADVLAAIQALKAEQ